MSKTATYNLFVIEYHLAVPYRWISEKLNNITYNILNKNKYNIHTEKIMCMKEDGKGRISSLPDYLM